MDRIFAHESAIGEKIKEKLLEDGRIKVYLPNEKGSTLLFTVMGEESASLAAELAKKGVCLRAGMHCSPLAHSALGTGGDALRLSFGAFNTVGEADAFVHILREITRKENIR
jgi:selenocysteine lyase/cysteine desulfurase